MFQRGDIQCRALYRNRTFNHYFDCDRAGWDPPDLTITEIPIMDMDIDFFTTFLANGLSLVVGVEFVKMLCRHSAQTVVEVLMFATARQMVVEHMKPSQTLIGVIAIAILFAIRKFLMTEDDDMAHAPVKKHADMNKDENIDEKE